MTALLIVDIQNDFLPGGSLAVPRGDEIIPIVNELMPEYDLLVATQDWHPEDHCSFAANHSGMEPGGVIEIEGLQQVLWPIHCVEGTDGAAFPKSLQHTRIDHVIRKGNDRSIDSYSGFFDNGRHQSTGLGNYLRSKDVTAVHIVGLATDYCVKFTVLDALTEGFQTILISDATKGVELSPGDMDRALVEMESAGAALVSSDRILSDAVTLYRPVGPEELALLKTDNFSGWPPRLPEQPIFYPVTNAEYAEAIAREWNLPESGSAAVTRFEVKRSFLRNYNRKVVGGSLHEEYWIPAEDVELLNRNIVGKIEVTKNL